MKRVISPFSLLLSSISAIIGSGWLFSSYLTSKIAGPSAIISWLIGGFLMIIIAFVFAELCAMIPITGSSIRIPQFTHGTLVSYVFSWMIWLSYLSLAPTEVQAVLQYSSFYFPSLTNIHSGQLTTHGYIVAAFLMLFISLINMYSLNWLMKFNSIFTIFKIFIPIIIIALIFSKNFSFQDIIHPENTIFMPFGWHGVVSALSSGGIVFAFNGFKQAAEMAGEAKNPKRTLPFAIIGSVFITMLIFLFLEMAFLVSLKPANLVYGWKNLVLFNNENSPIASILQQLNLHFWLFLLYIGAIIAPLAAGLMYCGSASRSLYGMSKNGYIPKIFQKVTPQGNMFYAITANFFIGMFMFAPLPGWSNMIAFLTSLIAVTYSIGPVCLLTLRDKIPNQKRPFKLPFVYLWSYISFLIATFLTYWSSWNIIKKMDIGLFIGLIILFIYKILNKTTKIDFKSSIWIWPYFIGLSFISYIGSYGGKHLFSTAWHEYFVLSIFCFIILWISRIFSLDAKSIQKYVKKNLS